LKIIGPNREEGGNEENFVMSCLIISSRRRVRFVTRRSIGEKRNAYRLLVGKSEGTRTVRRLRLMWEDIAKMLKKYDIM
jgi:hypothetical protein